LPTIILFLLGETVLSWQYYYYVVPTR